METISFKLQATPEQIAEIKKLQKSRRRTRTGTNVGDYLIEHFGDQIVTELIKHSDEQGNSTEH